MIDVSSSGHLERLVSGLLIQKKPWNLMEMETADYIPLHIFLLHFSVAFLADMLWSGTVREFIAVVKKTVTGIVE